MAPVNTDSLDRTTFRRMPRIRRPRFRRGALVPVAGPDTGAAAGGAQAA